MNPENHASFIPKKPIMAAPGRTTASIALFPLLAWTLFIVAVALSGAAYLYKGLVDKQIADDKASLERAKDAFDPGLIDQLIRLDSRLTTGKTLLGSHLAVTPLFDFISSITLRSVRFKDFDFAYLAPDKIKLSMKGEALSYAAVALQSDVFSAQKGLSDTLLSDMALDPSGMVTFSVTTLVSPSIVTYNASSTEP
ncbi:MAG TPA: hypothetical protein VIR98_00310 [Candidatus Paceibacterota bacterium]|jgi:hypothetical protein